MVTTSRKGRLRRIVRPVLLVASIITVIAVVAVWFCIARRPDWYRPPSLSETDVKRVRRESAVVVDGIGDSLVRRQAFEVLLTDREITEWLSALPRIWPASRDWWPRGLTEPVVRLEESRVLAAAHFESSGWRAILHVEFTVGVSEDGRRIDLVLLGAYAGSLSVPRTILDHLLGNYREAGGSMEDVGDVDDLFEGVFIPNSFVWPNGERPLRIDAIELTDGRIRVVLEPL